MEPPLIQDAFLPPVTEQDRPHCRGGATVAQEKTNARPPGGEWSPDRDRDAPTPGLEPRLFPYIWRHSKRDQLAICMVVLASVPFYFASLDLPKRIVNDAIIGKAFAHGEATAPFLNFEIAWPAFLGGGWTEIFNGFHADRQGLLLWLSGLFLILVLINGAFKFRINLQKGVLGERMLRRLRFQLFSLMLRFTPETQREVKSSETATIIRDEVEPIGSFIGDAIVVPVFLGTQAATALAFIMMQNMWLGIAAGGMVAVQMIVIPRLRREIIRLSRQRQIASRALAGRVCADQIVPYPPGIPVLVPGQVITPKIAEYLGNLLRWLSEPAEDIMRPVLLTKSSDWAYEAEHRVVLTGPPGGVYGRRRAGGACAVRTPSHGQPASGARGTRRRRAAPHGGGGGRGGERPEVERLPDPRRVRAGRRGVEGLRRSGWRPPRTRRVALAAPSPPPRLRRVRHRAGLPAEPPVRAAHRARGVGDPRRERLRGDAARVRRARPMPRVCVSPLRCGCGASRPRTRRATDRSGRAAAGTR